MPDPPSTKHKSSITIAIPMDLKPDKGLQKQKSPIHRVNGLKWRLNITHKHSNLSKYIVKASIHCDGDGSSKLWKTEAKMQMAFKREDGSIRKRGTVYHSFGSWKGVGNRCDLRPTFNIEFPNDNGLCSNKAVVVIETESESFARRPIIDSKSSINDVILVLEGHRFPVNKQVLAEQSSYFNSIFFGNFMESNQEEIEIKDTNSEDFGELLKMMFGVSTAPTTVENTIRYLEMADKFDIQIVNDRMENFLLFTELISIHRKILIAEEHRLDILKSEMLLLYHFDENSKKNLKALKKSPEFVELSDSMKNLLFENGPDLLE